MAGDKIIAPDGTEFVMKGINVQGPGSWEPRGLTQDVDLIADAWQFNSIRLIAGTKWNSFASGYNNNEIDNFDTIVKAFTSRGIVVMIDNHDYTSIFPRTDDTAYVNGEGHTIPSFSEFKAWWVDIAERFKDNPYVWFNVMNEPGGNARNQAAAERWSSLHDEAIQAIRATGAEKIIVVDDYFWGQANGYNGGKTSWDSAVIRMGPALNEKYDNLVFSLHVYEQWADGLNRFNNYFSDAKDLGLCTIVGEYGVMRTGNQVDQQQNAVRNMFDATIPNHIGRLCYAWFDRSLPLTTATSRGGWDIDKTDGTMPTNLTWIGELVWLDNHGELTAQAPEEEAPPLLQNADFSNGNTAWPTLWGGASAVSGSSVPSGKANAMMLPSGAVAGAVQPLELKPNTTYRLSGWGINGAALSGSNHSDISVQYNSGGMKYNTLLFTETEWTQKSITFTTPSELSKAELSIYKGVANVLFYAADLELIEVKP